MSTFVYQFRFAPAHLVESGKPELYFVFPYKRLAQLVRFLKKEMTSTKGSFLTYYQSYLEEAVSFEVKAEGFGFGGCASQKRIGGDYEIRLPMLHEHTARLCATISCIVRCGMCLVDPHTRDTKFPQQQIEFLTNTKNDMHGHSVWGHVYPSLGRWLKAQHGRLDPSVVLAMQSVWKEVCDPGHKKYKSECGAGLLSDGRFVFGCFGNACDLAIYPDEGTHDIENGLTRFSCHNLDTPAQQLTLLAGLAQMLTLAG